ncbi:hypothetical protein NCR94_08745, partial [Helicobacter sp. 16470-15]|nr:hypothetical protein [Helicobacter colisuis]
KELDSKTKELSSLPIKKQTLEIKNLEQDLINKQLHTNNPNTSHLIQNTSCFKGKLAYLNTLTTAKDRIHNHLS